MTETQALKERVKALEECLRSFLTLSYKHFSHQHNRETQALWEQYISIVDQIYEESKCPGP